MVNNQTIHVIIVKKQIIAVRIIRNNTGNKVIRMNVIKKTIKNNKKLLIFKNKSYKPEKIIIRTTAIKYLIIVFLTLNY